MEGTDMMRDLVDKAREMFEPECEQPCRQYVIIAILWILWFNIFSMNFIAYFHDYSRYSNEVFIMGLTFKNFSLMAGLITVVLDVITLWGLLGNTPFLERLPWGLRLGIVGIIAGIGLGVVFYTHFVSTPKEMADSDKDPVLSRKHHRVMLYAMILIIDIVMVMLQFSFDRNEMGFEFAGGSGTIDGVSQFGGCERTGTSFGNIFGLLFGLGGVAADALALRTQINYTPEAYNLPKHYD